MSGPRHTSEQLEATRPDRSNWVGANAGSGKTHVLTQRVARLLLAGAAPQKILCLTYTKAAAAEMQTRLFRMLGEWAMAPEDKLARILAELGGPGDGTPAGERMAEARRLFARALETPGGLKIQTIHAFCETLLRRFPLEAGVSPRFEVADEIDAATLLAKVRAEMAEEAERGGDDGFDRAARRLNEGGIGDLADAVLGRRADLAATDLATALAANLGEAARLNANETAAAALNELDWRSLAVLKAVLLDKGGKADGAVGAVLPVDPVERDGDPRGAVGRLMAKVLTGKMQPRSTKTFPTLSVKNAYPAAVDEFRRLTDWALRARDRLMAVEAVERTTDLHRFGQPLLNRYRDAKAAKGVLDFDDLIERARALLTGDGQRAWVLFKLDQGIDHILVDEAQDTSPAQWDVIAAIAEEFLSGAGARDEERTLFAVGDEKQSIYSFQGAEPAAFGRMRGHFEKRLADLGKPLGRPDLITSFRSAPAILDYVDAVFAGEAADGLTVDDSPIEHIAHRSDATGRVDLWPLVPRPEKPEPGPWWQAVDTVPPTDARIKLADLVAENIAGMIGSALLAARGDRPVRPVGPGDILVLVSRRDRLARGIIRGLKTRGVPVAGADRLELAAEIAVKDLLALAKFAVMPSDDLSLAALLRSPLCGVSEEALFALAHGRTGTLWQALLGSEGHEESRAMLSDMLTHADFLRPYEFLERVLTRHDGRRRLLARLGAEAEDPIDELLGQALAFERRHVPSLAGLIHWVETGGRKVKREMDRAAGQVRVMTVHGAKGLEAPVVILPDTISMGSPGAGRPLLLGVAQSGNAPALTLWAGTKDRDDPVTRKARMARDEAEAAERRRLLYVAMTRAEDWLILCGAEGGRAAPASWYGMLADGMERCAGVTVHSSPTGEGEMQRYQTGPDPVAELAGASRPEQPTTPPAPDWLRAAPREVRTERLSPSALAAHGAAGGAGLGRELAMRRGTAVHAILERADLGSPDMVAAAADPLLAGEFADLPSRLHAGIIAEASAVLAMPQAAMIFGADALAEVAVAIDPPRTGPRMIGRIDRLVIGDDHVLLIDIKTDASPPADASATDASATDASATDASATDASAADASAIDNAYLAQLGAYMAAIRPEFPGLEIRPAILWTAIARLDIIAAEIVIDSFAANRRA